MNEGKQAILASIRRQLGRGPERGEDLEAIRTGMVAPNQTVIPLRGQTQGESRLDLFQKMVTHVKATSQRVAYQEIVPAIKEWLKPRGLPLDISISAELREMKLPLDEFNVREEIPKADGAVAVTSAFAGIAETGTLVVACTGKHPHTLNILPQQHIVVLPEDRIVANYEESWQKLKHVWGNTMPRTLLWITGPSRTGDIEQTMMLGAHGPKELHILLVR